MKKEKKGGGRGGKGGRLGKWKGGVGGERVNVEEGGDGGFVRMFEEWGVLWKWKLMGGGMFKEELRVMGREGGGV